MITQVTEPRLALRQIRSELFYWLTNSLNSSSSHTSLQLTNVGSSSLQWGQPIPDKVVGKIGSS